MTNQKQAKEIYNSFSRLKSLSQSSTGIDLAKAKELSFMKKNDNYKVVMGDEGATWKSFLAQPEIQPMHLSKATRLVAIYSTYIEKFGLSEDDIIGIDSNSLHRLATIVDEKTVRLWIEKARTLSRYDLYREIKYGDIDEIKCEHNWETKTNKTCLKCGVKEKI